MFIEEDLYKKIQCVMPISCVDLLIEDEQRKVFLAKRNNEPCKGQWFTPGGRIYHGETRIKAAERKFTEELGLNRRHIIYLNNIGTYDFFSGSLHCVTTIYKLTLRQSKVTDIKLDNQHEVYQWQRPKEWLNNYKLHPMITEQLQLFLLNEELKKIGRKEMTRC
jgi:colanic acid biosynthesis protein WcaH